MIKRFVEIFDANRSRLLEIFKTAHPAGYGTIVETVIQMLEDTLSSNDDNYSGDVPDAKRITVIDHGDYQGTLLYIIAATGYQPSNFWYLKMGYGSCSYCDTFQSIGDLDSRYDENDNEVGPSDRQAEAYLTLALHVVQGLRPMQEDSI